MLPRPSAFFQNPRCFFTTVKIMDLDSSGAIDRLNLTIIWAAVTRTMPNEEEQTSCLPVWT